MANGLDININDYVWLEECLECELPQLCCNESCQGRVWVAPCGTIDYETGELTSPEPFCEPLGITSISHSDNASIREKRYQGCKISRRRGIPDFSLDLTFDICQGDYGTSLLLSRCAIDVVVAPLANNVNLELNPSLFDQQTKVFWGRILGDSYTWEYPEDDCQSTSREYMTDRFCWSTGTESEIADANAA